MHRVYSIAHILRYHQQTKRLGDNVTFLSMTRVVHLFPEIPEKFQVEERRPVLGRLHLLRPGTREESPLALLPPGQEQRRKDRPGGADQGFQRPGDPAGQDGGEEAVAEVRVCFALSALRAIDRFAKRSITGQLVVSI
jgi:hypothetical protein